MLGKNFLPNGHWLTPGEQEYVIEAMLRYGILKYSNRFDLPLKSGGTTDIYVNIRDGRSNAEMNRIFARQFMNPIFRLNPARFSEVPDAVSCIAGIIQDKLDLPLVTIRKEAKEGRVSDAMMIGEMRRGDRIVCFDDVITDGASKVVPYRELTRRGAYLLPLVVMVDRQQGWKKYFEKNDIDWSVWSGMTLHHIRRYLIEKDIMQRCDPKMEEKNPLIVALDGKDWEEILPVMEKLRTTGCILKFNDLVLYEGIKNLCPDAQVYGRDMIDLKGHDISNTLKNIAKRLLQNPPWAVTVHASGGFEMIKAVVDMLKGTPTKVLAVTVLTSMDPHTCEEIYTRLPIEQVRAMAAIAHAAGAHGLVSSAHEVKELRNLYPSMTLVTPGIRSAGADVGDQARVETPEAAMANGSSHLVMGRQILTAANPVAEIKRLLAEELKISL